MQDSPLAARSAGVLLHPTSLSGRGPVGTLGPEARRFIEFLEAAGQSFWQMLPIHPIGGGDSPYDSPSAFAGAPHLISLEDLARDGLLPLGSLPPPTPAAPRVDFARARAESEPLFQLAFETFEGSAPTQLRVAYDAFVASHQSWVWDFALFSALKSHSNGQPWTSWPRELRQRQHAALERAHAELAREVRYHVFLQFCFHRQWSELRAFAGERGVKLMGDVPMFVAHDSVDVWANQHLFFLDADGRRVVQAGVPPDYFSADGQLWGNPLYRWNVMRADGYGWWVDRLRRELEKFDAVRLDHFIAFSRYWEVPADATTAKTGRYLDGPAYDFFEQANRALGGLPFVAEDLGIVTREVELLRDHFQLPGMKILQFAFSPGAESYLCHRHGATSVVYTGTHDNDTTRGWYEGLQERAQVSPEAALELSRVRAYTGATAPAQVVEALLRALYASPSRTAIVPLQDLLGLGVEARMNVPGVADGNWTYRASPSDLTHELAAKLRLLSEVTERIPARVTL